MDPSRRRLLRYMPCTGIFLSASSLRLLYRNRILAKGLAADPQASDWVQQFTYLSLWYATLYVVVEGWKELSLVNGEVEELLAFHERVESLRRFRSGVFHFQATYWDDRLIDFLGQGAVSAELVRLVHNALGRDLLRRLEADS